MVLLTDTLASGMFDRLGLGSAVIGERYRVRGPHIGHRLHLCELVAEGRLSMEEIKGMVKDARFICKTCGRAAAEELHLCDPVPL